MKFKIVNMFDVVCDYVEAKCKKERLSLEQFYKKYPDEKKDLLAARMETKNRIVYTGKWRAGWISPDNKLLTSSHMHHYDLLYYYFYGDTGIKEEDDMFRGIITKDGWAQIWNGRELNVDTNFDNIDRVVNLVVNFRPMYKIFDRIVFQKVVRGRSVRRVVELKESAVEEIGFSLMNPRR